MLSKNILGVRVDIENYESVIGFIKNKLHNDTELIEARYDNKVSIIATLNLEFLMKAQQNKRFMNFLNLKSDLNTIDGVGIINALKLYKIKFHKRVCGSDLVINLADICETENKKYFILGASEEISLKAKEVLKNKYPKLIIENYSPPFSKDFDFNEEETDRIKNIIGVFKPDVICVALGSPKQEFWIEKNIDFLNSIGVKIVIGVGGSFDFVAGKVKRAPDWYRDNGLEWLYRLFKEPKTRFKRQISTIPLFYCLVFKEFILKGMK